MKNILIIIFVLIGISAVLAFGFRTTQRLSGTTIATFQGGTGTSSPSGILSGDNSATTHLNTVKIGSNLTFIGGILSATGSGTIGTSSQETAGHLGYWTTTNGFPARLGDVATTGVSCTGSVSCTGFTVIGPSPITISSSGGGTPGGDDTQIQFNDSGTFSADWGLTYRKSATFPYKPQLALGDTSTTSIVFQTGGSGNDYVDIFGQNINGSAYFDLFASTNGGSDLDIFDSNGEIFLPTSQNQYFNTPFNFGIGTTSPFAGFSLVSSSTNISAFAIATSTVGGSENPIFEIDNNGHIITSGRKPTLSSCGNGNTLNGTDTNGTIMFTGIAVTTCTLNRASPVKVGNNLSCIASDNSAVGFANVTSTSTTAVVFGISTGINAGTIFYHCDENINN